MKKQSTATIAECIEEHRPLLTVKVNQKIQNVKTNCFNLGSWSKKCVDWFCWNTDGVKGLVFKYLAVLFKMFSSGAIPSKDYCNWSILG